MGGRHMIARPMVLRLAQMFMGSLQLQHDYMLSWLVVAHLYETAFIRKQISVSLYGGFVPVPAVVRGYEQSSVVALYALALCPGMSKQDVCDLFMSIRLRSEDDSEPRGVQRLPPQRGQLKMLDRYLVEHDLDVGHGIYEPLDGAPMHMRKFMYGMACIDLMGFFPATDGDAMRRVERTKTPESSQSQIRPPAVASTYRGEITSLDIVPFIDIGVFASTMHNSDRVNGWQCTVLPVCVECPQITRNRQSGLYGAISILYDCVSRYPIDRVSAQRGVPFVE
jgi:hypothetical protein